MKLHCITYTSKATVRVAGPASVKKIVSQASANNASLGISGVLLYGGGYFTQAIEGYERSLRELYTKIAADDRHTDCRVLYDGPLAKRCFSDWRMGLLDLEQPCEADAAVWEAMASVALARKAPGQEPVHPVVYLKAFADRFRDRRLTA